LTKDWLGRGVVGFDVAGDETQHPLEKHLNVIFQIKFF
jgi:hypothetical protein